MSTKQMLLEAKDLIKDPKAWTKKAYARNTERFEVDIFSPDAVCWCSFGALAKVTGSYREDAYLRLVLTVKEAMQESEKEFDSIIDFNDNPNTTHQDVMNVFDRAIEMSD